MNPGFSKVRLPISVPYIAHNEKAYVAKCMETGWISSQGDFVKQFEHDFAKFTGAKFAVSVSNGTAALHLTLIALGIRPGDEVIVPNMTFAATANAVIHCGATPVLCDVDKNTWTLDCQQAEALITAKTKAIIPVHLFGVPADMTSLMNLAAKYQLKIVEDCAQAIGAKVNSDTVGTIGHAGCFSFFANKTMTTGEGGMVTTNDESLFQKLLCYRDHGMRKERRYWHEVPGLNYRLTNLQAAIGVAQLEQITHLIETRKNIAQAYRKGLDDVAGVLSATPLNGTSSVTWLSSFRFNPEYFKWDIDTIVAMLGRQGIETRRFFPVLNIQPPYLNQHRHFKVSDRLAQEGLCLPTWVGLREQDITEVVEQIKDCLC
ncbi:DegT/DnrJ/EryC1/StrS family aminotransferase [Planctobacterium marinum]|uniref:GDP-perosamine synthase n=1 Tax=Planctobacterium marinum TaxID=1631968 RepID=A0AA48HMY6_9ALTE|nr:aminotransferase DegT [Planctobacterium marinum]